MNSQEPVIPNYDSEIDINVEDNSNIGQYLDPFKTKMALQSAEKCLEMAEKFILCFEKESLNINNNIPDKTVQKVEIKSIVSEALDVCARTNSLMSYQKNEQISSNFQNANKLKDNEARLELYLTEINDLKKRCSDYETKLNEDQIKIKNLESELEAKSLQIRSFQETYESLKDSHRMKQSEIDELKNEITSVKSELEKHKGNSSSAAQLKRLKDHLVEVQDQYTLEISNLEEAKRKHESLLQNMSLEHNRTKLNLHEARENYEKRIQLLTTQLNHTSSERDSLSSQIVQLSKQSDDNSKTIITLRDALNDCQKEFESQLSIMKENYETVLFETKAAAADQLSTSLSELQASLSNKYDQELKEINKKTQEYLLTIANLEKTISEKSISNEDSASIKINKILLQNLLIAFTKVSQDHKPFVFRLICNILEVDLKELQPEPTQSYLSWIPGIGRLFVQPTKSDTNSSLSQLFVEYLEEESKKISILDPNIPPISTEELKNIVSRHQLQYS